MPLADPRWNRASWRAVLPEPKIWKTESASRTKDCHPWIQNVFSLQSYSMRTSFKSNLWCTKTCNNDAVIHMPYLSKWFKIMWAGLTQSSVSCFFSYVLQASSKQKALGSISVTVGQRTADGQQWPTLAHAPFVHWIMNNK